MHLIQQPSGGAAHIDVRVPDHDAAVLRAGVRGLARHGCGLPNVEGIGLLRWCQLDRFRRWRRLLKAACLNPMDIVND